MENYTKKFKIIFSGQLISLLTSQIVQYTIIWYLTFKTGSAVVLALATIAGILPQIVLGPFAGVIIDRLNRKKVMIISDMFTAIATLALSISFLFVDPNIWYIYLILLLRSLGTTFHSPSLQASIPLMVPKDKIVKISGINQSINSISTMLSPIIAGVLYGIMKIQYIVLIDILGAIIGIACIAVVKIPRIIKNDKKIGILSEMKEGFLELTKSKFLIIITIFVVSIQFIFMPISSMFPLMISSYFGLDAIYISMAESIFAIGMFSGGIFLAKTGGFKRKQITMIVSMIIFGIFLSISGILPVSAYYIFLGICLILGACAPLFSGVYISILQLKINHKRLGRVLTLTTSLMLLATPFGVLFCAPFAEKLGIQTWFLISGILILIISLVTLGFKEIQKEK